MDLLTILGIIGTLSGVGALALGFNEQWVHKERRKSLVGIGVFLLIAGLLLSIAAYRGRSSSPDGTQEAKPDIAPGMTQPTTPPQSPSPQNDGGSARPEAEEPAPPEAAPPAPTTEQPYNSWLRAEELTILYDARRWIDGGCTDATLALGDFSPGGWGSGPGVQCRPDGWLAFDARRLLDSPRFYLDHTYCLNFRNGLGNWGQHGGTQPAPGMYAIGVPAADGPRGGINIGFRITRTASGHVIQFTKQGIAHCQG